MLVYYVVEDFLILETAQHGNAVICWKIFIGFQGFIQDFSKRGGNHLTPPTYQETVPITNVLTARIHLWKNYRCL